jgi:CxxC motif-containing protein (DUF1111 family)
MALGLTGIAQQSATEAPAGFDTPTLAQNPGSQSHNNGLTAPLSAPNDTYALDQQAYEQVHDVSTGLGPVYNARACAECHQNPVSGGASQFTELRVGHLDASGVFQNPLIPIADSPTCVPGTPTCISGRSIVNDRAVKPEAQEHIPATENIRALRAALNTLGDGFVEAIDDDTLKTIAQGQPGLSEGRIHGEAIEVPIFEASGQTGVGRFGWKDQHASLLSFAADAYLNEMGVTNRLRPHDTTTIGKTTADPEDVPDNVKMADIDHFAQFIRGTKVPPPDKTLAGTADAMAGQAIFEKIGCSTCHVGTIVTAHVGKMINGGMFMVPEALGDKIIHPYSDFLLHDIETGDGIVQTATFPETANKLRTSPLWGLRMRPRFMHDLKSLTLADAIERHQGEAEHVEHRFDRLSPTEKQQLFTFLKSL